MQQRSSAFFGVVALGIVLLLFGIVYGLGSRSTNYKSVAQGNIAHYLTSDGTNYLQMDGNPALYIIHENNFSPKLTSFADGDTISFVYDPAETTSIDVQSSIGTHLNGTAAKVVEITASDTNGQRVYKTPEYISNPQGYNRNQWGLGGGLIVVGLLALVGAFFLPRKKTPAVVIPSYMGTPVSGTPPFPYPQQPMQQPYSQQPVQQQPYPTQYPSTPGAFQQAPGAGYPQPPNPYEQPQPPANPYGQPQPPANPYGQPQYPNPYNQPPQQ